MKQCNYVVYFINGVRVFKSAKTGRTLTGAAKLACERAEAEREAREQEAINEAVENALIMSWYEENADLIEAEQRETRATCRNIHGATFVLTSATTVTIWPSAFGQGFTRAQAHTWLAEIRAKRHAERTASMKRSHNTAHKQATSRAVDYVARRILGGKAIREGKRIHVVFTRRIVSLRSLAWQGLPPRACGQIGVVKDGNTFKAWTFVGGLQSWVITKVYAGLNFPVVLDITKKGGDDDPSKGSQPSNDEGDYEAFCDKLDEIIHDEQKETPKQIAITGWALTEKMIRDLETAYEDEDVKEALTHTYKKLTAQFIRNSLVCMGWSYNADRGTQRNAVIDFLRKRDTEKFPIFTTAKYDVISTLMAIQAVNRCMIHAKKNSTNAVTVNKEIRPILARLCRKMIQGMQPTIDD